MIDYFILNCLFHDRLNPRIQVSKWNSSRIEDKALEYCLPRVLNDNIILVLMKRMNTDEIPNNVLEMYDQNKGAWKTWDPIAEDVKAEEEIFRGASCREPWKFFVGHGE